MRHKLKLGAAPALPAGLGDRFLTPALPPAHVPQWGYLPNWLNK